MSEPLVLTVRWTGVRCDGCQEFINLSEIAPTIEATRSLLHCIGWATTDCGQFDVCAKCFTEFTRPASEVES